MYKKAWCTYKVVVLPNKPIAVLTFLLPSPSSLLQLPNDNDDDDDDDDDDVVYEDKDFETAVEWQWINPLSPFLCCYVGARSEDSSNPRDCWLCGNHRYTTNSVVSETAFKLTFQARKLLLQSSFKGIPLYCGHLSFLADKIAYELWNALSS